MFAALLEGEPFHIVFDREMLVQSYGRSLLALQPTLSIGVACTECLELQVPMGASFGELRDKGRVQKATIRLRSLNLSLRGQFVFAADGSGGVFLGSPWFTRIEEFAEKKIALNMLPAHYGILENLFILQTNQTTIRDFKRLVAELNLKRMQLSEAREEALQAADAKARFLAMMSHEIRTPMNGIMGMLHLLSHTSLSAEQSEYLETIRDCSEGLHQILNDVLDISKLEADKFAIENKPFQLSALVLSVARLFRPLIEGKGLAFEVECSWNSDTEVLADANRVRQVLVNLLANALKFTDAGVIRFICVPGPEHNQIRFEIQDTGIGMSAETLQSIFQPFEQGRSEGERGRGGTGLGLTISRKLCELMGGTVVAEAIQPHGTRFIASIKAEQQRATAVPLHITASALVEIPLGTEVQILLVEDNDINALLVKRLISKWGGVVVHAKNGLEAVSLAEANRFDLILMDCQMPVMDGFEATRIIRAGAGKSRAASIIALTANALQESRKMCEAAGMNDFVAKPIDAAQLKVVIQSWLKV